MSNPENIIQKLQSSLPVVFSRSEIERLMPGIINSKTLANIDSAGDGPPYYKWGGRSYILVIPFKLVGQENQKG